MDKKVIFAVAGSGKTTYIVNNLSLEKRSLVVTYTVANYLNLQKKIMKRFDGVIPNNISIMTFFSFLYKFCYKPFAIDRFKAKGICFKKEIKPPKWAKRRERSFYLTSNAYVYSNRLSLLIEDFHLDDVRARLMNYFDEIIIDEIQDIAGRDFDFLKAMMNFDLNMLFVGDFYQHTFDTSRDGNCNKSLFSDKQKYEKIFKSSGFQCDSQTLENSWRCCPEVCDFVSSRLGIDMKSNRKDGGSVINIVDMEQGLRIWQNDSIVKLHYENCHKYRGNHRNYGDVKGEDCYEDVCVLLYPRLLQLYSEGDLSSLSQVSKNKFYVALTRAKKNIYLIDEKQLLKEVDE